MKKTIKTITLDFDVWLYHRTNDTNISGICNSVLRNLMNLEQDSVSEDVVQAERVVNELKQSLKDQQNSLNEALVVLSVAKKNAEEQSKKNAEENEQREVVRDQYAESI